MEWWQSLREWEALYSAVLVVLGAMAGSFASAAIYRLPREDMSMTKPRRSNCTNCGYQLRWHDNLPILSYLLLRGKCRQCKSVIGFIYFWNEIFLAGVFWWVGLHSWAVGIGPLAIGIVLVVLTALWICTVIDWGHRILPDEITMGGIPFAIIASVLVPELHLWSGEGVPLFVDLFGLSTESAPWSLALGSSLLGAICSFILLFGIRALFSYLLGQEALGFGDVKYMTAVGGLLGLEGSLWVLMVGVAIGSLLGVGNVVRMIFVVWARRRRKKSIHPPMSTLRLGWLWGREIPFGPPLVVGTMLLLLFPHTARTFFLETWPAFVRDCLY